MRQMIATLVTALTFAAPATADGPVLLELYTSQGCSSCPPADALLHDLSERDDVIPLALHVDYWDYIGWADSFADPQFTRRQQDYAAVVGDRTIYTPQMIVAGEDRVIGTKPSQVADAIVTQKEPTGVSIEVARSGNRLTISGETLRSLPNDTIIQVARFSPRETVDIRRGENAGRTLTYTNIVTAWDVVGEWSGRRDLDLTVPVTGDAPIVVIVQEQGPGAVFATAVLR